MLLKNLIKDIPKIKKYYYFGLSINSNDVKKLHFLLLKKKFNGENYIKKAIKKGASVIVCSKTVVSMIGKLSLLKQTIRFY